MNTAAVQVLRCQAGDHDWSRPIAKGRAPKSCPEHPNPAPPSQQPERHAADVRRWYHSGSDVTTAEVREWVQSLGLDVHPRLKGKVADILIARYNREHPDRPYVRGGAA